VRDEMRDWVNQAFRTGEEAIEKGKIGITSCIPRIITSIKIDYRLDKDISIDLKLGATGK